MNNQYHLFSKVIHWSTALIIMGLLFLGFYMTTLDYSTDKLALYDLHKSFGLLVFLLFAVRIAGYFVFPKPKPLETHAKWEKILSKFIHYLFYAALILMPLSGWVMSSAAEYAVKFFGLPVPAITGKDESLFNLSRETHEIIAFIIIGGLFLHIVGAYKHHLIDKDETLERMTVKPLGFASLAVLTIVILGAYLPGALLAGQHVYKEVQSSQKSRPDIIPESASITEQQEEEVFSSGEIEWIIDTETSRVNFTATQYGQAFQGTFKIAQADLDFDRDQLEESRVRVLIDISSIKTGASDRDSQALSPDWFAASEYPHAIFESTDFQKKDTGYLARGTLTVRGNQQPLDLPFTLDFGRNEEGLETADMKAGLTLNRLNYGIGQGQWEATDAIGGDVEISIDVKAVKQ